MERGGFLNEKKYQKTKKMMLIVALVVFFGGLIGGGALIMTGVMKAQSNERERIEWENQTVAELQEDVVTLSREIEELEVRLSDLRGQWAESKDFAESVKLNDEISKIEVEKASKKTDLWMKENELKLGNGGGLFSSTMPIMGEETGYYFGGGAVILVSAMIALMITLIAKRREMMAFKMQQTIPVVGEAMTKMAPVVGKAAGDMAEKSAKGAGKVAEGVAKGVSKGWREGQK